MATKSRGMKRDRSGGSGWERDEDDGTKKVRGGNEQGGSGGGGGAGGDGADGVNGDGSNDERECAGGDIKYSHTKIEQRTVCGATIRGHVYCRETLVDERARACVPAARLHRSRAPTTAAMDAREPDDREFKDEMRGGKDRKDRTVGKQGGERPGKKEDGVEKERSSGCQDLDGKCVDRAVAVRDARAQHSGNIYPNPNGICRYYDVRCTPLYWIINRTYLYGGLNYSPDILASMFDTDAVKMDVEVHLAICQNYESLRSRVNSLAGQSYHTVSCDGRWMLCTDQRNQNDDILYAIYSIASVARTASPVFTGHVRASVTVRWATTKKKTPTLVCMVDTEAPDVADVVYVPFAAKAKVRELFYARAPEVPESVVAIVCEYMDRIDLLHTACDPAVESLVYCAQCDSVSEEWDTSMCSEFNDLLCAHCR